MTTATFSAEDWGLSRLVGDWSVTVRVGSDWSVRVGFALLGKVWLWENVCN
jgi:hypothetical protein